jgi:WD40 repeat protein
VLKRQQRRQCEEARRRWRGFLQGMNSTALAKLWWAAPGTLVLSHRPSPSRPRAHPGGEDGTVRVWDLRTPGCQREYGSRAAVNTVVLHPNQGELISGRGGGGAQAGPAQSRQASHC